MRTCILLQAKSNKVEQRIELSITDTAHVAVSDTAHNMNVTVKVDAAKDQSKQLIEELKKDGYVKDGMVDISFEKGVLTINGKTLDAAATAKYSDLLPKNQNIKLAYKLK